MNGSRFVSVFLAAWLTVMPAAAVLCAEKPAEAPRTEEGDPMDDDAYAALDEHAGINCYELVMAEPVKGFALSFTREKFPIGHGEILENSSRFSLDRLLGLIGKFGSRSMQTLGVIYPYWENAARGLEDWSCLLLFLCLLCLALPCVTAAVLLIRFLKRGRDKVGEDPVWQQLSAVKNGNYAKAPYGPYNWMGFPASVQRYLGILWLLKTLYPDFVTYDLYTEVNRFYELFFHCTLTEEQYLTILG